MKLTCFLVVIGLLGMGLVARGGQPAGAGPTGNDYEHSTGNAVHPATHPTETLGRRAPGQRGGLVPVAHGATAMPPAGQGNDIHHAGELHCAYRAPTIVVVYNQVPSAGSEVALADYVNQQEQGYYQPGYEWGVVLKANTVDWAEFIPYLQEYIVSAPAVGKDAFRRGFLAGFGGSAPATYDYALRQASQRS